MMSGTLEDAIRQLAHQRLTVGSTFARDDQQGIAQQVVEVYCIQRMSMPGRQVAFIYCRNA